MKTIVLLAVLGVAFAYPQYETERQVEIRGLITDGINKTINDILANLTEVISIDSIPIDFGDGDTIKGGFNATSIKIQGLKSLVATKIDLDIFSLSLDMTLHLDEMLDNLKYWADILVLNLVPLYGEGRINVVLDDIDLTVGGHADLSDGFSLSNITIGITLGEANFDLSGLINNAEFSALVSQALDDNFANFINNNQEVITNIISPIVESIINAVLHPDDETFKEVGKLVEEYRGYQ